MAIAVYFLNDILIDIYSINGAALSTLIVVFIFTVLKTLYIKVKLNISPYSTNSIKVLASILVVYFLLNSFDLKLNSILEIAVNTFVILFLYLIIIYKLEASKAINSFINNLFRGEFRL